ncbi:hypothetical protein BDF22DRAFT_741944 [Syncephalis plumigaleata]|nr:hypothetical protein BDF22DRAFT_741944 [Syncephalis plumigaleata]
MESTRNHDANDYDYPPEVIIQAVLRRQLSDVMTTMVVLYWHTVHPRHLLVPNTRSWINDEDLLPVRRHTSNVRENNDYHPDYTSSEMTRTFRKYQ